MASAVNLTTLSYTQIDAEVKRLADCVTGRFRDDFQQRAPTFLNVVKQVQSTSVGAVTAAGLESASGSQAQARVAVSVKSSNPGVPEQEPRAWRTRSAVDKDGGGAKVSAVQSNLPPGAGRSQRVEPAVSVDFNTPTDGCGRNHCRILRPQRDSRYSAEPDTRLTAVNTPMTQGEHVIQPLTSSAPTRTTTASLRSMSVNARTLTTFLGSNDVDPYH